jgi:hypothetical protein
MIGQYVRKVVAPNTRVGTIKAARFKRDHVSFLFHQDPRLVYTLPDVWMRESELEECRQLTDEQVAMINNMETGPLITFRVADDAEVVAVPHDGQWVGRILTASAISFCSRDWRGE